MDIPYERRKAGDRRQYGEQVEPPYLSREGWVFVERRQAPDRRFSDALSLSQDEVEEIEIKPL